MRVLVTGAAGWTAASIIRALHRAGNEVIGFDLPGAAYREEVASLLVERHSGDVSVDDDVHRSVAHATVDAIIHLAVAVGERDYDRPEPPFAVNVRGTYHVFDAARTHGVGRLLVASSAAVHLSPPGSSERVDAESAWMSSPDGDHLYDLTKRLQEVIARDFCETFGMTAVVLRFGHIVDGRQGVDPSGRELATLQYCLGGWVCRYDVARACVGALALREPGYSAFHVIGSEEARVRFGIDRTERALGMVFETRFEAYGSNQRRP